MEEDRQRPKQGQNSRRVGFTHGAAVFILRPIPAMMLPIFDRPMIPNHFQQGLGAGLIRPQAGYKINHFLGVFDHLALAQGVHDPFDAYQLRRATQSQGLGLDLTAPQLPLFNPTVAFVQRLSLRGEKSPTAVVGLWRTRAVGCL